MHYTANIAAKGLQHTLKAPINCAGIGVHSGEKARLSLKPAAPDTGIVFVRNDVIGLNNRIDARWDNVPKTQLCTVLRNDAGVEVGTVEHVMAALRACGIDNAVIGVDGPEVPIMDGSAADFVFLIECAGIAAQDAPRRMIKIARPIEVTEDGKTARLVPGDGAVFDFRIDFRPKAALRQSFQFELSAAGFKEHLASARTFGFADEVELLRQHGFARGGSLENAVVIDGETVLNEGGLRYPDEMVRHKVLDAIGDLYLAGAQIVGHYQGHKAGHALNNRLLHALFAQPQAWHWVTEVDVLASGQPAWQAAASA